MAVVKQPPSAKANGQDAGCERGDRGDRRRGVSTENGFRGIGVVRGAADTTRPRKTSVKPAIADEDPMKACTASLSATTGTAFHGGQADANDRTQGGDRSGSSSGRMRSP